MDRWPFLSINNQEIFDRSVLLCGLRVMHPEDQLLSMRNIGSDKYEGLFRFWMKNLGFRRWKVVIPQKLFEIVLVSV